jgi:hypothetical protein
VSPTPIYVVACSVHTLYWKLVFLPPLSDSGLHLLSLRLEDVAGRFQRLLLTPSLLIWLQALPRVIKTPAGRGVAWHVNSAEIARENGPARMRYQLVSVCKHKRHVVDGSNSSVYWFSIWLIPCTNIMFDIVHCPMYWHCSLSDVYISKNTTFRELVLLLPSDDLVILICYCFLFQYQ